MILLRPPDLHPLAGDPAEALQPPPLGQLLGINQLLEGMKEEEVTKG